jgi:hypothetical protein
MNSTIPPERGDQFKPSQIGFARDGELSYGVTGSCAAYRSDGRKIGAPWSVGGDQGPQAAGMAVVRRAGPYRTLCYPRKITISTRRFFPFPASVVLAASGRW